MVDLPKLASCSRSETARCLADHLHSAALYDRVHIRDPCAARRTIVRHRERVADKVDEALAHGARITRERRWCVQELIKVCPTIRLAVPAVLLLKECKHSAGVIKAAVAKVLAKRNECGAHCPCVALPLYFLPLSYFPHFLRYTCTLVHSWRTLQYLYYSKAYMLLSIRQLTSSCVRRGRHASRAWRWVGKHVPSAFSSRDDSDDTGFVFSETFIMSLAAPRYCKHLLQKTHSNRFLRRVTEK